MRDEGSRQPDYSSRLPGGGEEDESSGRAKARGTEVREGTSEDFMRLHATDHSTEKK
jgi:hypothetical protein